MALIKNLWKQWIGIILMILILGGCTFLNSTSGEVSDLIETQETINEVNELEENNESEVKPDSLKDELTKFYKQIFAVTEKDILQLNAYPVKLTEGYWKEYEKIQSSSLELLKGFISPKLEEKLKERFITTSIHFPRFIEINGSVIIKYLYVEDVAYEIIEKEEQKYTLLTDVVVKTETIPKDKFNEIYAKDNEMNFYKKNNQEIIIEDMYKDEIKVICSYIVELEQNDAGKISIISLKENGEVIVREENRRDIINNDFVQRAYYLDKPTTSDSGLLQLFFNQFMNQDKDSYQYYQYAYDMNTDIFNQMLVDLDLSDYLALDREGYKNQFPKTIIPTKDDITSVIVKKDDINTNLHIDTSQKSRKYIIEIPAKVSLSDYSSANIIYRYFAVVEDKAEQGAKISRIQYLSIETDIPIEEQENENGENSEESILGQEEK